ncbi:hypothetical protein CF386_10605 [Paraphotobacterium marinum]|uniref:Uncharacterized protein n=1 Tax=Paraphotobacterium marinum TaxID=1755811 RepID=A0A220VGR5_9GAMM|nr:hypothetical protein [Paraphotobacterium marinum]ASK79501.1 hypothetical protein CF386_10605 [Paraphotobacterium marinum]
MKKSIVLISLLSVFAVSSVANAEKIKLAGPNGKIVIGNHGVKIVGNDYDRHHHHHREHGKTVIKKEHCNHHKCVTKKVVKKY